MPSGSKKRKAAKKKKEKGATNSSTHSHEPGDGDLKVSSPISEHNDEHHPITEEEIEKNKKDPSSVPSENEIGEAMEKVRKSSSSSSSSRSSSSSSGGSSSDDESLNSVEKNVVMMEPNDPFVAETPSDLPELLNEENAAILEDKKLDVTVTPVLPIEDHNEMEKEKNSSADLQIDLGQVKEEIEACNSSAIDPPSTSINQDKKVSLVEEEMMGEEKYVVLEENTTNIVTEPKLEIDQSVSNTIATSFQEHRGKDYQSTTSIENQEKGNSPPKVLQRTSWASCCGLFELFSGTNR